MHKTVLGFLAALMMFTMTGHGARDVHGVVTTVFPVSFAGKSWQPAVYGDPGKCLGCGKITNKALSAVLRGELDDFSKDFLPLDPGGTVYLYFDSLTNWRVGTNANGTGLVPLQGRVANDGQFWMLGTWNFGTNGSVFVVGKAKFNTGNFIPKSVKGTVYFFSETIDTGLVLKAKTGKPLL